jgi:GT2 family glycosyltransferase
VIGLDRNRGFAAACNAGARASRGDILYFLNTDARVDDGFLDPVVKRFDDPEVFAVGSREGAAQASRTLVVPVPFFRFGLFGHRYCEILQRADPIRLSFVSAGHAGLSRAKFLALGGFDELYRPFYWEDVDLCYRAWRRGWQVLLEPASRVEHTRQGTIGRFYRPHRIGAIYWKNRFLFVWKNIRDPAWVAQHLAWLPLVLGGHAAARGPAVLRGFLAALGQAGEAIEKRRASLGEGRLSDREIVRSTFPLVEGAREHG